MKKAIVAIAICASLVTVSLVGTASAADPFKDLWRKVQRLETRVTNIQAQVASQKEELRDFEGFFFFCLVPNPAVAPTAITGNDGAATTGVPLYADSRCLASTTANESLKSAFKSFRS